MNRQFFKPLLAMTAVLPLCLCSCGVMKTTGNATAAVAQKSADAIKQSASAAGHGIAGLTDKAKAIPKPRFGGLFGKADVEVVDVRESDLKKLESGRDKAIAYERQQNQIAKISNTTFDYKEPALPSSAGVYEGGLLPLPDEIGN